jgi:ATP-dependent helicase/nuclease subunit A
VITSSSPWIAVQAQPGSGKTYVLVERLSRLLEMQGKGEVVAITFTEKAAQEIKKRLCERRVEKSLAISRLWISTIHGFCLRILKEYGWLMGHSPSFSILSDEEQIFFLKIAMRDAFMELEASEPYFNLLSVYEFSQCEAMIRELFTFRFRLKSLSPPLPLPKDQMSLTIYQDLKFVFERVLSRYEALKKEHQASDFDDLLFSSLCLLRKEDEVRKELRRRFSAILVDEFQDTDEIQKEILDLLTKYEDGKDRPPSLMIVGDVNQSIYRFRGANVDLFRNLKEDIVLKGGAAFQLVQNFRSSEPVIEFVNCLFEPLLGRDFLKSLSGVPTAGIPTAGVEYWVPAGGDTPQGRMREAEWLAAYMRSFCKKDDVEMRTPQVRPLQVRPPQGWSHIAILFRGMTYSHLYEKALSEAGIPWVKSSESRFYEKREILGLLAPLKWVCDPSADYSLWLTLSNPLSGLPSDVLNLLAVSWAKRRPNQRKKHEPLESFLKSLAYEGEAVKKCHPEDSSHFATRGFVLGMTFFQCLKNFYFKLERLKSLKGSVSLTEWYAEFVMKMTPVTSRFLETVVQFERRYPRADWEDFLIYMEALKSAAVKSSTEEFQGDGVRIMTVHQAKGLEFEVVFLPDLGYLPKGAKGESPWLLIDKKLGIGLKIPSEKPFEWKGDGVYQEIQDAEKGAQIEESKRIFYVAATRAKKRLILSHSSFIFGKPRKESWACWMEENKERLKPYIKEGQFE